MKISGLFACFALGLGSMAPLVHAGISPVARTVSEDGTLAVAVTDTYTGGTLSGGTLTIGSSSLLLGNTPVALGDYEGKFDKTPAGGNALAGSIHIDLASNNTHLSGYFTLPRKTPKTVTSTTEFINGVAAVETVTTRSINFRGKLHAASGHGFIRETWVDPVTHRVAYKPGAAKIRVYRVGDSVVGDFVTPEGTAFKFQADYVAPTITTTNTTNIGGLILGVNGATTSGLTLTGSGAGSAATIILGGSGTVVPGG